MRNRSPRSFTVETKSGGRHQRTFIPHRASAPTIPRPVVFWPPPAEPQASAAEPRRILPNLIAAEPAQVEAEPAPAQPERIQVPEKHLPRPRRGRPPKAKPVAAEMVEEPIARSAPKVSPAEPVLTPASRTQPTPMVRITKPSAALPPGERWKRRLRQWAR